MDYQLTQTGQEVQNILDQAPITQQDLNAEISEREGADINLQRNIDDEKSARESTDIQLSGRITDIDELIPEQASEQNKLADKSFVNSSIATNTATYRGSKNLVSDLHLAIDATDQQIAEALAAAIPIAENNDYCFVQVPTSTETPTEISHIDRYKYDGTEWVYEFTLNNSSFTAEQWAAINSTITSGLVEKLSELPNNADLQSALNGKQPTIGDLETIRSNALKGASAYQKFVDGIQENDLSANLQNLTTNRMWVVNFGSEADTVQFVNLYGGIRIIRLSGVNITKIKISYGNVIEQEVSMGDAAINIEDGQTVTIKVVKTSDHQSASLNMKFKILVV